MNHSNSNKNNNRNQNQNQGNPSMKILLLVLLILGNASAFAEESVGGFGIHGGANFTYFDFGTTMLNNAKSNQTGILAGVHFEGFNFADMLSVRIEGNYSEKGYKVGDFNINHNYLEIPVLLKFMPMAGPVGIFIEGGAAASLHLSTSAEVQGISTSYTDNTNWDFSLIGGAGLSFKVNPVIIQLEGRYNYGLSNLTNDAGVDVKSRTVQLIAGVTFLFI